jgi:hypothetical protein
LGSSGTDYRAAATTLPTALAAATVVRASILAVRGASLCALAAVVAASCVSLPAKDQPAPAKAPPQPVTFEVTHGDVAQATEAKDQPATAKAAPALVIVRAVYGDLQSARIADVTEKVRGMATADGLAVVASNGNFGDPAFGTVKQLRIEYTLDGEQMEKAVRENETLAIGSKNKAERHGLPQRRVADRSEAAAPNVPAESRGERSEPAGLGGKGTPPPEIFRGEPPQPGTPPFQSLNGLRIHGERLAPFSVRWLTECKKHWIPDATSYDPIIAEAPERMKRLLDLQ